MRQLRPRNRAQRRQARRSAQVGSLIRWPLHAITSTNDFKTTRKVIRHAQDAGFYVATLSRIRVDQNITQTSNRTVVNRLCMSIDVQHRKIFQAPDSNTRRMNDAENACRFIAALRPTR
ncbi:hypothetical protein RHPLAN_63790 [Rhodoplanes sp. Z2-YC6860]|nr:hypothetical protein RHPLAN_63790 [Rhodoplanes sp. Z2-YC6860]